MRSFLFASAASNKRGLKIHTHVFLRQGVNEAAQNRVELDRPKHKKMKTCFQMFQKLDIHNNPNIK